MFSILPGFVKNAAHKKGILNKTFGIFKLPTPLMEEFQNLMAYDILFTPMKDIVTTGIL